MKFCLLLLSALIFCSYSHHVVFEEIGEMAGALSHIHAIVPVNISGLRRAVNNFQKDVIRLQQKYQQKKSPIGTQHEYNEHFHRRIFNLLDLAIADADDMTQTISSLQNSLPQVVERPASALPHQHEFRIKKRSPFTIIHGIFGTLMGWFNHQRLNNLKDQIGQVQDQQNRLLQIQTVQLHQLEEIEAAVHTLTRALETGHSAFLNYGSLDHARSQLRFNLHKLIRALQAAHYRRLSLDLLPSHRLKDLFEAAVLKAQAHKHQLLLRHPSDLLQIETSYLHDGQDVQLILHIPMAPTDSLLRLFQLHPFPLPFTDTHMLMPDPVNQILAISSSAERLSIEVSAVNLLGCHRINQVYLCKRHGVLKRELNTTCLGSLYMQDLEGAMTLCEMDIVPEVETVLQLQDNWYLVHLPRSLTSYVSCLNSSTSEIFIKSGASRIYVSPSCRLQLRQHILISHFTLHLDGVIKHYEWELDRVAFSPDEQARSVEWLSVLDDEKVGKSTLTAIRQSLAVERHSSVWWYVISTFSILLILGLAVFIGYVVVVRHFMTLRSRVMTWICLLFPEAVPLDDAPAEPRP